MSDHEAALLPQKFGKFGMIEACVPALRHYASALVRNQQDQDDLVHDCLVLALDRWPTYRGYSSVQAWLFSIMRNLFIKRTRARASLDGASAEAFGLLPEQEYRIEIRETLRALNEMPDEQRRVLVLIAIEDRSYAEVVQMLGIPIGTVMSRISCGRERLRRMVESGVDRWRGGNE